MEYYQGICYSYELGDPKYQGENIVLSTPRYQSIIEVITEIAKEADHFLNDQISSVAISHITTEVSGTVTPDSAYDFLTAQYNDEGWLEDLAEEPLEKLARSLSSVLDAWSQESHIELSHTEATDIIRITPDRFKHLIKHLQEINYVLKPGYYKVGGHNGVPQDRGLVAVTPYLITWVVKSRNQNQIIYTFKQQIVPPVANNPQIDYLDCPSGSVATAELLLALQQEFYEFVLEEVSEADYNEYIEYVIRGTTHKVEKPY